MGGSQKEHVGDRKSALLKPIAILEFKINFREKMPHLVSLFYFLTFGVTTGRKKGVRLCVASFNEKMNGCHLWVIVFEPMSHSCPDALHPMEVLGVPQSNSTSVYTIWHCVQGNI